MAHSKHNDASVKSSHNERGNGNLIQQSFNGKEQHFEHGRPTKTQKVNMEKQVCLLSWYDKEELVVATADILSKDPKVKVHHVPLGHDFGKVSVH